MVLPTHHSTPRGIIVLGLGILVLNHSIAEPLAQAAAAPTVQQPRCSSTQHPVSPFPASFWLVKTVKTGSTTLAAVFRQICGLYGVVPVRKLWFNPLEGMPDTKAAAALQQVLLTMRNATDAPELSIITHLNYSDAKFAAFQAVLDGRRPLLFTTVRHPLNRTFSHFIQAKCAVAASILGGKIIECDRNSTYLNKLLELDTIRNRWAFARVPARHNLVYNYIKGSATTPEAAVGQYDFVFVAERMDEALVLFMLEFGLRLQDIAYLPSKVRTGKYTPANEMPQELNSYVLATNHQDLLVWQHANAELDRRRQQVEQRCGAGTVDNALAQFQELQAAVKQQCADFKSWYAANRMPEQQHTYVNDEGWGWRCVRHAAQAWAEGRLQQQHQGDAGTLASAAAGDAVSGIATHEQQPAAAAGDITYHW